MLASDAVPRATGLLVIEVRNSNPNGDPDRESDPRVRSHDQRGMITGVSLKRKLRDLVLQKDGPVWTQVSKALGITTRSGDFDVLERRDLRRSDVEALIKRDKEAFKQRFWDARVFGNTFLEKDLGSDTVRSGVANFGLAVSISPVRILRLTLTKVAPAQKGAGEEKGPTRGMAPLGYRVVEHGVYCMPFAVNPTAAGKTGCSPTDIKLLLALLPYAYAHTASHNRPFVNIRHAWYAEHSSPLGSCAEHVIIDALTPKRKGGRETPSASWDDYVDVNPPELRGVTVRDLINDPVVST